MSTNKMGPLVNKIGPLTRLSCFILGWNPDILKECGEASFRTLRRYTSAIIILSILWGVIGYCFADRYIGIQTVWGNLLVASVFIVVIICIERFIILTVGKLGITGVFRLFLAILMAVLGATVIDQIIFSNDIEVQMKTLRTEKINAEIPKRNQHLDEQILELTAERNAAQRTYDSLYRIYSLNPVLETKEVLTSFTDGGIDAEGNKLPDITTKTVKTNTVENPLIGQVDLYKKQVEQLDKSISDRKFEKLQTADTVREEFQQAKNGFLEELHALIDVITSDYVAMIFYLILFAFLLMLELLVVTSKTKDTNSDYDMIIEHQLKLKGRALKEAENSLINYNSIRY